MITQDETFTNEVLSLNEIKSFDEFDVMVGRIFKEGRLLIYTSRMKMQNVDNQQSLNRSGNEYQVSNAKVNKIAVLNETNAVGDMDDLDTEFDMTSIQVDSARNDLTD